LFCFVHRVVVFSVLSLFRVVVCSVLFIELLFFLFCLYSELLFVLFCVELLLLFYNSVSCPYSLFPPRSGVSPSVPRSP
jgi:hypothetical protein